jgi:hypothetical protein
MTDTEKKLMPCAFEKKKRNEESDDEVAIVKVPVDNVDSPEDGCSPVNLMLRYGQ